MNHSPADVLRWLLVAVGAATDPDDGGAWPCYESVEPSVPDNCLTVYDTTGQADGRSMVDGDIFYHYGVQVRVRSTDPKTGFAKADSLRNTMATGIYAATVTVDGNTYRVHCLSHIGPVLDIGKNVPTTKRSLHTVNALISVRQVS